MIILTDTIVMVKILVTAGLALLVGGGLSYFLWNFALKKKKDSIIKEAEAEGEAQKRDKMLQAKERFLQLKTEHEKYINEKNSKIIATENRLNQKEMHLSQKIEEQQRARNELEALRENMNIQLGLLDKRTEEMERLHRQQVEQLETISGLSAEDAKNQLIESLREEAKTQAISYVNEIMAEAKMTANREAKKVVVETIQRVASETAIENSVTVFNIESDEIKGRIIGREGRNIRALEAATGVEIIVDDTPEAIILSAFDPVRREIARLALHQLVTDGSIHPARIEEIVEKTRKQVEEEIVEVGKRTTIDLGIHGLASRTDPAGG